MINGKTFLTGVLVATLAALPTIPNYSHNHRFTVKEVKHHTCYGGEMEWVKYNVEDNLQGSRVDRGHSGTLTACFNSEWSEFYRGLSGLKNGDIIHEDEIQLISPFAWTMKQMGKYYHNYPGLTLDFSRVENL